MPLSDKSNLAAYVYLDTIPLLLCLEVKNRRSLHFCPLLDPDINTVTAKIPVLYKISREAAVGASSGRVLGEARYNPRLGVVLWVICFPAEHEWPLCLLVTAIRC